MSSPGIDFGALGGAVESIFGGIGDQAAHHAYTQAAAATEEAAQFTSESGKIQQYQQARAAAGIIGAQKAEVGGAGFAASGSANYMRMSSENQMGLGLALTGVQTGINVLGLEAQKASELGQAAQAKQAARGGFLGGLLKAVGAVAGAVSIFSDRRLKRDITRVGQHAYGINLYRFRYTWRDEFFIGVMADEVEKVMPEAVGEVAGFKTVDYNRLGLELRECA